MNPVHIHLFLNHVPVLGNVFAVILLAYALLRRSDELIRIGLLILVLTGLVAIPVFLTGEPAEEIVEKIAGVSEAIIEQHENYAKFALGTAILRGIAAFLTFLFSFWSQKNLTWMVIAIFFLAIISGSWMLKTASLGGQIRHPEIASAQTQQNAPKTEKDDDDDH